MKKAKQKKYRVFAGEGLDGVGKTTILKLLAEQTGGCYMYCTDGNPLKRYRGYFDTKSPLLRYFYYVALPLFNYFKIKKLRKSSDVFVDRTIASTVAVHKALGVSDIWFKLIPPFLINQYDAMIYFTVSEKERRRRLSKRRSTRETMTFTDKKSLSLAKKIDQSYKGLFMGRTMVIKTDNKTPQEIVKEIKNKLYLGQDTFYEAR